jgi:hypothetical protein
MVAPDHAAVTKELIDCSPLPGGSVCDPVHRHKFKPIVTSSGFREIDPMPARNPSNFEAAEVHDLDEAQTARRAAVDRGGDAQRNSPIDRARGD